MQIEQLNTIATFFGALVALIIFINWKKQKGSEVISNEAKEAFHLVKSLPHQTNIILENMLKMAIENATPNVPNDFEKYRFENFKDLNVEIIKKLDLITFNNKDRKTLTIIENYMNSYKNFGILYFRPTTTKIVLELHTRYKDDLNCLKTELYKYILYKKTI
ncbi:hypothetical protein [Acinetobacter sp. ANC 4470]|uniref:hypothetical protein n=1 Tax=Acinetobacter sp. ANC 4470 TaxID=1977881 RepID=UPI001D179B2B|nr:hypothetical protein [Acinetobacter sp. ANC 4470]